MMRASSFMAGIIALLAIACQTTEPAEGAESASAEVSAGAKCSAVDAACIAEARDVGRIDAAVTSALGVSVTCRSSAAHKIGLPSGGYYFGASVRCTPSRAPAAAAGFAQAMEAQGFHSFAFEAGVVIGQSSSRACKAPSGDQACLADAQDTTRLQGVLWASLGVGIECSAAAPRRIESAGGHYYLSDVSCTTSSTPKPADAAAFDARMKAYGIGGYAIGTDGVIRGTWSSRPCASY